MELKNEMFLVEFGELIGNFNSIIETERKWKKLQNWRVGLRLTSCWYRLAFYIKTNAHYVTDYDVRLLNRGKLPLQIVFNVQLDPASLTRPGIRMTLVSGVSK